MLCWRQSRERGRSLDLIASIAADGEIVAIGTIKTQHVGNGDAFSRQDNLTHTKKLGSPGYRKQLGHSRVGGGGVDVLICIGQFHAKLTFEDHEERSAFE